MGGKQAVAEMLVREMIALKPSATTFVDLFGGGGSMSFMALQLGLKVVYNEYDTHLSSFMAYLVNRVASGQQGQYGMFPDEWYTFVTREMFTEQKRKQLLS
jgi:site-specific DNA-adenine methylase